MSKKYLHIGDMHGRWDKFFTKDFTPLYRIEDFDKIIFFGDYWDSFDVDFETQKRTFNAIINLKKRYPEKFVLLLGNHDVHYLYLDVKYRCSGFQDKYSAAIHALMSDNKNLFDYFFVYENTVCSHAGIIGHFEYVMLDRYGLTWKDYGAVKVGNEPKELFYVGRDNGGRDIFDGPLWIRPNILKRYPAFEDDIVQVFGHTYNPYMQVCMEEGCKYFNIDCSQNLVKTIGGDFEIIEL